MDERRIEHGGRARAAIFTALFALLSIHAPAASAQTFAKGAEVSWITQMESSGYRWYNDAGTQQDLLQIPKDHGMNTIRLRVCRQHQRRTCQHRFDDGDR